MADQVFLARLEPSERDALEAAGRHRRFGAGQALFFEGEEGRDVYVLVEGLVKVVMTAPPGKQVILGLESAGSMLGELSPSTARPRGPRPSGDPVDAMVLPVGFRSPSPDKPRWRPNCWGGGQLRRTSDVQLEFGAGDSLAGCAAASSFMIGRFGDSEDVPSVSLPIARQSWPISPGSPARRLKGLRRLRQFG